MSSLLLSDKQSNRYSTPTYALFPTGEMSVKQETSSYLCWLLCVLQRKFYMHERDVKLVNGNLWYLVLQSAAVCCSVLQCVAVCCSER